MEAPQKEPLTRSTRPRRLVLVFNGKGGVGKSFFSVHYVQWLKSKEVDFHAIDTDNENSTLIRFHPESHFASLEEQQDLDVIFTSLKERELVVVDCRAASTDLLLDYFEEIDLSSLLEQLKASLVIVSPVNHETDSIEQVRVITDQLGDTAHYLIVKNQSHSEDFDLFDQSKVRQTLHDSLGAQEIVMPKLKDWLVTTLQKTNLAASAAAHAEATSLMNRQRLVTWTNRFEQQLEDHLDLLTPDNKQNR